MSGRGLRGGQAKPEAKTPYSNGDPMNMSSSPPTRSTSSSSVHNEYPQEYADPDRYYCDESYCFAMVGLPGTGKTFVAQRMARWLEFFHDCNVKLFNLGNKRREMHGASVPHTFFDSERKDHNKVWSSIRSECLKEVKSFLVPDTRARIAIYDACSHTREARRWLLQHLDKSTKVIFIEILTDDTKILEQHLCHVITSMPDYKKMEKKDAISDYQSRIGHFRKSYISMSDPSLSWIKLSNNAEQLSLNRIKGFFPGEIVNFLMNLHTMPRPIYLTRHGQSKYNMLGKIGGDSGLTGEGESYARKLAKFMKDHVLKVDCDEHGQRLCENPARARLYTSTLRRTKETVQFVDHTVQKDGWVTLRVRQWRALDEIFAGVMDGMTYEEIKKKAPKAYSARKADKLTYRYPRGESYLDLIKRVEQCVLHMQRHKDPVVMVAHQAVLRVIYTYLMGLDRSEATTVSIPLNTVIKLCPYPYHTTEKRFVLHEFKNKSALLVHPH